MNKELIEKLKKLKGLYDDCDVWSIKESEGFKERLVNYQASHSLEEPEEKIDGPENPLFGDYKEVQRPRSYNDYEKLIGKGIYKAAVDEDECYHIDEERYDKACKCLKAGKDGYKEGRFGGFSIGTK